MSTIAEAVARAPLRRGDNGDAVKAVQVALRAFGHELIADGDFGSITKAAVKDFQVSHGLTVDGVVGPATAAALDAGRVSDAGREPAIIAPPAPSVMNVAPWLSVMRAITGTKEVAGAADSPVILGWAKEIGILYPDLKGTIGWYNHDSIPWCGLAAAYAMAKAGFKPPSLALGAINWFNDWSNGYRLEHGCPGAVLVKSRTGGGHVTFYECEDANYYYCRGGNQSDMVNVAAIRKDETVKGFMWPKGGPLPGERKFGSIASARAGGSEA